MKVLAALFASAALLSAAPACSGGGEPAQTPRTSTVSTDGQKSMPGGARFSRESRAMQACWARASQLGSPSVPGLGLRSEGGFVIRGSIDPPQEPAAGSPRRARLSFECEVGLDGVVTRFTAR